MKYMLSEVCLIWHNGAYVRSLSRGATCHEGPLFLWTSGGRPWQVLLYMYVFHLNWFYLHVRSYCCCGQWVWDCSWLFQEEKAELKALNYLLEKEKGSMQLQLCGKESQEHAYLIQIDHLKSEITEQYQVTVATTSHRNSPIAGCPVIIVFQLFPSLFVQS